MSRKTGPWPPWGTIQSAAPGMARYISTAISTGSRKSRSPQTMSVDAVILTKTGGVKFMWSWLSFIPRCHSHKAAICSSPSLWPFRIVSHSTADWFFDRNLPHDRAGLLWKIPCRADHDRSLNSLGFDSRHMGKNVAAPADANRLASFDAKMVQPSESILSALPVCDFLFADASGVHARGRPERSGSTPARIARGRHEPNLHGSRPFHAETEAVLQNRLSPKTRRYR